LISSQLFDLALEKEILIYFGCATAK